MTKVNLYPAIGVPINSNKRCFWIDVVRGAITSVHPINSNKRCFWIIEKAYKEYAVARLTVTNVVFELINPVFLLELNYWLTVTNVVFELKEHGFYKSGTVINSNKRCFWMGLNRI